MASRYVVSTLWSSLKWERRGVFGAVCNADAVQQLGVLSQKMSSLRDQMQEAQEILIRCSEVVVFFKYIF